MGDKDGSAGVVGGDDALERGHQGGVGEAVEGAAALPLRTHAIHVSEAGEGALGEHPLGVVVLLVPQHARQVDVEHVEDLEAVGAPGVLERPAPRLGHEGRDGEVGGEPVLEDTAVELAILEDGLHAVAQRGPQVVVLEAVGGGGEAAPRQLEEALGAGGVGHLALVDEGPGDQQVGGDVVELPQRQAHAHQVLPVHVLRRRDRGHDLRVHEGGVLRDRVREEQPLRGRLAESHEALGVGGRRAGLARRLLVVPGDLLQARPVDLLDGPGEGGGPHVDLGVVVDELPALHGGVVVAEARLANFGWHFEGHPPLHRTPSLSDAGLPHAHAQQEHHHYQLPHHKFMRIILPTSDIKLRLSPWSHPSQTLPRPAGRGCEPPAAKAGTGYTGSFITGKFCQNRQLSRNNRRFAKIKKNILIYRPESVKTHIEKFLIGNSQQLIRDIYEKLKVKWSLFEDARHRVICNDQIQILARRWRKRQQ